MKQKRNLGICSGGFLNVFLLSISLETLHIIFNQFFNNERVEVFHCCVFDVALAKMTVHPVVAQPAA